MAPHTLLIERQEATAPVQGGRVAWPRIKRVIAHQWELGRPELAWLCFCPPEAVRITRVGPVHLAHGGDWAYGRELESLRWKLLYPIPLSIRGKAVAVGPDLERPCCWRALSEWEATNTESVGEVLLQVPELGGLTPLGAVPHCSVAGFRHGQTVGDLRCNRWVLPQPSAAGSRRTSACR